MTLLSFAGMAYPNKTALVGQYETLSYKELFSQFYLLNAELSKVQLDSLLERHDIFVYLNGEKNKWSTIKILDGNKNEVQVGKLDKKMLKGLGN